MKERDAPPQAAASLRRGLSTGDLWILLAIFLPAVAALATTISAIDLAYHIRTGDLMLETGRLARRDTFTFSVPGADWLDQQWGTQAVLALVFKGGWAALAVFRAALVGGISSLVYLACRAAGARRRAGALLAIGSFVVSMAGLGLRPQLLGAALFSCTLWLLADEERHPRRVLAIPALTVVWANIHGSFIFGPFLCGMTWLRSRLGHRPGSVGLLRVTIASAAATLVGPFGPRVWAYVVDIATDPEVSRTVAEWQPPSLRDLPGALFFLSVFAVAYALITRRIAIDAVHLILLGTFLLVALLAVRGIVWWALIVPPVLAGAFDPGERKRADTPRPLSLAVPVVLIALGGVFGARWLGQEPLQPSPALVRDAPAGITGALRQVLAPGDRVFNAQRWGSWLELAFPDNPVFVDSRIEIFPSRVWRDYFDVSDGREGWQGILDTWGADVVVAERRQQEQLLRRIADDPEWRLVHEDDDGAVFVRT